MLTTESSEKYGTISMMDHFKRIAVEGQEYDPYTTLFASKLKYRSGYKDARNNNCAPD